MGNSSESIFNLKNILSEKEIMHELNLVDCKEHNLMLTKSVGF